MSLTCIGRTACSLLVLLMVASAPLAAQSDTILLSLTHPLYRDLDHGDTLRLECNGLVLITLEDVVATGDCNDSVSISFSESVNVYPQPLEGALSLMACTFTAVDACAHEGLLTVYVEIVDTTPPLLQDVPDDLELAPEEALPAVPAVYAIDDCTRDLAVDFIEMIVSEQLVHRTWSTRDNAGNTAAATQTITRRLTSEPCADFDPFSEQLLQVESTGCEQLTVVCLGEQLEPGTSLKLNSLPTAGSEFCESVEVVKYNLITLFGSNDVGPFEVTWHVGEGAYRERLANRAAMLDFFNTTSPQADWQLDASGEAVSGLFNARFHALTATSASSRETRVAEPIRGLRNTGTAIALLPGRHNIVARNAQTCADTVVVEVSCVEVEEVYVTAVQGLQGKHCLDVAGGVQDYTYSYLEQQLHDRVAVGPVHNGCINFSALEPGDASLLVEVCHRATGSCERIRVNIRVFSREDVKPPRAVADLYAVAYNGQRMLEALANDEIVGGVTMLHVDPLVTRGDVRVDASNRLHYRAPADWCGYDRIAYEVCNAGGCDTTSVRIQVTCEDLLVFNGFSPNADGQNDYFTVLGIEKYPNNSLLIFNAHGHEVYSAASYINDWDGSYRGTPLLDGTYFYVLTVQGREPESGYVQIRR